MIESPFSLSDETREAIGAYLGSQPEVVLAFLFGSYARGQARLDSDVDCAVLLSAGVPAAAYLDHRLRLMDGLARLLDRSDVDVAILNEVPLPLAFRVLREGQLLFERDHASYVRYRVDILTRYLDFEPFLARFERAFLRHVSQEGILYGHDPYRSAPTADADLNPTAERAPDDAT